MPLTSSGSVGRFRSSRAPNQSEYTLIPPSDCPTNQDHLTSLHCCRACSAAEVRGFSVPCLPWSFRRPFGEHLQPRAAPHPCPRPQRAPATGRLQCCEPRSSKRRGTGFVSNGPPPGTRSFRGIDLARSRRLGHSVAEAAAQIAPPVGSGLRKSTLSMCLRPPRRGCFMAWARRRNPLETLIVVGMALRHPHHALVVVRSHGSAPGRLPSRPPDSAKRNSQPLAGTNRVGYDESSRLALLMRCPLY